MAEPIKPRNGLDKCQCGAKYWESDSCAYCDKKFHGKACEQQCHKPADVYAGGPKAGDWAGYYCQPCAEALKFVIFNTLK